MDMAVKAAISYDLLLSSNNIGVGADDHVRINTIHNIRVASFADTYDNAILDTDISLIDTSVVNDQSVGENQVQAVDIRTSRGLTHAITNTFSATKGTLITILSKVFLDLDPQISSTQTDKVAGGGTKHGNVGFTLESEHFKVSRITSWLWCVMETTLLQFLNKTFGNPSIVEGTSCKTIATFDDLVTTNLDEVDGLSVTRLETDGSSSSNVQSVSKGSDTIEVQQRVCFDKVVVRSNLLALTLARSSSVTTNMYLDGTVSLADNLQLYPLSILVQDNLAVLEWDDCTGLLLMGVFRGIGMREDIFIGYGQEAAIQGLLKVAVIGADRVMDGDQVGARGEGSFYLQLCQGIDDGRQNMSTAEDGLAQGHEICH